jgi:hypothetical protein
MLVMSSEILAIEHRQVDAARVWRTGGAKIGFGVALGFVAVGAVLLFLFNTTDVAMWIAVLGSATLITGTIVGRWFGPRRGSKRDGRLSTSFAMAVAATAVGDLLVGFGGTMVGMVGSDAGPLLGTVYSIGIAFLLWPFGIVIYGLVALPITFGAALIWWHLMGRIGSTTG